MVHPIYNIGSDNYSLNHWQSNIKNRVFFKKKCTVHPIYNIGSDKYSLNHWQCLESNIFCTECSESNMESTLCI